MSKNLSIFPDKIQQRGGYSARVRSEIIHYIESDADVFTNEMAKHRSELERYTDTIVKLTKNSKFVRMNSIFVDTKSVN